MLHNVTHNVTNANTGPVSSVWVALVEKLAEKLDSLGSSVMFPLKSDSFTSAVSLSLLSLDSFSV